LLINIELSHYGHDTLFFLVSFFFPLRGNGLLYLLNGDFSIAQGASLGCVSDVSFEPVVNAVSMKHMSTGWEFSN